jgi:hypothetical protein
MEKFSEPIQICSKAKATDAAGGVIESIETIHDTVNAIITQLAPNKDSNGSRQEFGQSYKIEFWKNPNYVIDESYYIKFRSFRLTIQSVLFTQDDKKVIITAAR